MKEKILAIVEEYKKSGSIKKTAGTMNLSTSVVRKSLVTAGVWSNSAAVEIAKLRREHPDWTNERIASEMKLSVQSVHLYTPYEGMEWMADSIDNVEEHNNEVIDSGKCGNAAVWTLTKGGLLTISGSGPMWDYTGTCWGVDVSPRPKWWARRDGINVRKVVVEEGITTIGQYALNGMITLSEISLPKSLLKIEGAAFGGENHVKKIVIPENVPVIPWDAFYLNVLLEEVHIPAATRRFQSYSFHACMSLKRMFLYGDAPEIAATAFDMCPAGALTVYHRENAKGFSPTMWNGYKTKVF